MNKRAILVVEDDESIRSLLSYILQSEGFDVLTASDGRMALEILEQGNKPSWILLDITMPVMSGTECLKEFRKNPVWANIPVTLLSAHVRIEEHAKALKVCYLKKPIDIDLLLKLAEEYR